MSACPVTTGRARRLPQQAGRFPSGVGLVALALSTLMAGAVAAQVRSGPSAAPMPPPLPTPLDQPFHGTIELAVNATDTDHQVFSVHETIPVQAPGDTVLLYPKWETGSHASTATVAELARLMVRVDGFSTRALLATIESAASTPLNIRATFRRRAGT